VEIETRVLVSILLKVVSELIALLEEALRSRQIVVNISEEVIDMRQFLRLRLLESYHHFLATPLFNLVAGSLVHPPLRFEEHEQPMTATVVRANDREKEEKNKEKEGKRRGEREEAEERERDLMIGFLPV